MITNNCGGRKMPGCLKKGVIGSIHVGGNAEKDKVAWSCSKMIVEKGGCKMHFQQIDLKIDQNLLEMFLCLVTTNKDITTVAETFNERVVVIYNKFNRNLRQEYPDLYAIVEPQIRKTKFANEIFDLSNRFLDAPCTIDELAKREGKPIEKIWQLLIEVLPNLDQLLGEEVKREFDKMGNHVKYLNKGTIDSEGNHIENSAYRCDNIITGINWTGEAKKSWFDMAEYITVLYVEKGSLNEIPIPAKRTLIYMSRYISGIYGEPDPTLVKAVKKLCGENFTQYAFTENLNGMLKVRNNSEVDIENWKKAKMILCKQLINELKRNNSIVLVASKFNIQPLTVIGYLKMYSEGLFDSQEYELSKDMIQLIEQAKKEKNKIRLGRCSLAEKSDLCIMQMLFYLKYRSMTKVGNVFGINGSQISVNFREYSNEDSEFAPRFPTLIKKVDQILVQNRKKRYVSA